MNATNGLFQLNSSSSSNQLNEIIANINPNIGWRRTYFPWNQPNYGISNSTHIACVSSNLTVQVACCTAVNAIFVNSTRQATTNTTNSYGNINYCELPNNVTYTSVYNITSPPAAVQAYATCFNQSVPEALRPDYASNVTTQSSIWQCEVAGNFNGSVPFGIPLHSENSISGARARKANYKGSGLVAIVMIAIISLSIL